MLEKRGAETVRCPLLSILDTPDQNKVTLWLNEFIASPPEWMIFLTGEGLRRLTKAAGRQGVQDQWIESLAHTQTLIRGPKPGKALREIGLRENLRGAQPTSEGIIETLKTLNINNCKIGVQLYGEEPNKPLIRCIEKEHATPFIVAPYIYASAADDQKVLALIDQLESGKIDVIAFTSLQQVTRLFKLAKRQQRQEALSNALKCTIVASVGPVVADSLDSYGIKTDLMPEESFFMKPLVRLIVARIGACP